jgi:nucleotide-binding universal stress UspA family protein
MAFPYRRILAPVEFDETAHAVLDAAMRIAAENGGTIFLMHVVPLVVAPTGMPNYVDIYKDQEKIARQKLESMVERQRSEVKCELMTRIGDPAHEILAMKRQTASDLIVLATPGRKGVRRMLLGSVADAVLRDATCPVLTVQRQESDMHRVAKWMTRIRLAQSRPRNSRPCAPRCSPVIFAPCQSSVPAGSRELSLIAICAATKAISTIQRSGSR